MIVLVDDFVPEHPPSAETRQQIREWWDSIPPAERPLGIVIDADTGGLAWAPELFEP